MVKRLHVIIANNEKSGRDTFVAVSGGSQPSILSQSFLQSTINWETVHFFFTDERFVKLTHPDSNFEAWNRLFFIPVSPVSFPHL